MSDKRLSAASVVRQAAVAADRDARVFKHRAHRVAAKHLHALADRLERAAQAERASKRRRRGSPLAAEDGPLVSPDAGADEATWQATRRTPTSVTLRRVKGER